ncbi:CheW-like domain-containing protein [Desulfuromusa kysingii]|uniref:CheW-like domain-containing protein n=2 Tax=Desulfuromusa kysingii TaxID=37625 RepID=A0A1H4C384_9BACT|nr:chemotaxis protein CheW [Desulfuromusa kysingii]SEA54839.1 CheW-like domain-containing protein [Desulfuromusa kysingii]
MSCNRRLVFRLGRMGFLLELTDVVEVVDQIKNDIDPGRSDMRQGIVSALKFRKSWIPAVDPALILDISSTLRLQDKVAVILRGFEGNWALLVDQADELFAAESFKPCEIPFLLKTSATGFYSQIKLLNQEPVIVFEPERYYGSSAVAV